MRHALGVGIILSSLFATLIYTAPCGIHGSAQKGSREYALNPFRNRSQAPPAVNPSITLDKLAQGKRFRNTEAASVIGYVVLVMPGGQETCNCKAGDAAHKDTHIALVPGLAGTIDESKYINLDRD